MTTAAISGRRSLVSIAAAQGEESARLGHDTFSTWAYETNAARPDVIEACLSHRETNKVKAAYNRAQFAAERRALLTSWANYLSGQAPSNVVQINDIRAAA